MDLATNDDDLNFTSNGFMTTQSLAMEKRHSNSGSIKLWNKTMQNAMMQKKLFLQCFSTRTKVSEIKMGSPNYCNVYYKTRLRCVMQIARMIRLTGFFFLCVLSLIFPDANTSSHEVQTQQTQRYYNKVNTQGNFGQQIRANAVIKLMSKAGSTFWKNATKFVVICYHQQN